MEAHFVYFWGLVAKWLSGGLWRLIPGQASGPGFSFSLWLEGEFEGKPWVPFLGGQQDFPRDARLKEKLSRTVNLNN